MKFLFREVIINRDGNNIHAISDTDGVTIDCKITNKTLKWIMKRVDKSTRIIDTNVYDNDTLLNTDNANNKNDIIDFIEVDDPSQITDIIIDWFNKNKKYFKDGE